MLLLPRPSIVMGQRFSPASDEITNNAEKVTRVFNRAIASC